MSSTEKAPAPWLWAALMLPFGASAGYVMVTLGFVLTQAGHDPVTVAGLIAAGLVPHTWKFLWAPVADLTLTRKRWYLVAIAVTCTTVGAFGFARGELELLTALVFVNSVAISFLGMSVEGLMVHTTPKAALGRAGGWFMAGNLGGSGLGGGLALIIAERTSGEVASLVTALMLAACTLALLAVPTPDEPREGRPIAAVKAVARDVWGVFGSRVGIVAIVLCLVPLGAGAAAGLFSSVAGEWGADGDLVALVQGVLGGVVSMFGCLAGGWMADRMSRREAYLAAGLALALVSIAMAILPRVPATFVICTLAYSFATGLVYGTYAAFVLEAIGKGAAATKYNALAALTNLRILYMTLILGAAAKEHGAAVMLWIDAGAAVAGALVLYLVVWTLGVRPVARP